MIPTTPVTTSLEHWRTLNRLLVGALLLLTATACSNQQVYTAIQERERQECAKLPQAQYEDCMAEVAGSYDEYEQARQDMKKDSQKKQAHTGS